MESNFFASGLIVGIILTIIVFVALSKYDKFRKQKENDKKDASKIKSNNTPIIIMDINDYSEFKNVCETKFTEIIKRVYALENERKTFKYDLTNQVYTKVLKDHRNDVDNANDTLKRFATEIENLKKQVERKQDAENPISKMIIDIANEKIVEEIGKQIDLNTKSIDNLEKQIAQLKSVKNVSNQKKR